MNLKTGYRITKEREHGNHLTNYTGEICTTGETIDRDMELLRYFGDTLRDSRDEREYKDDGEETTGITEKHYSTIQQTQMPIRNRERMSSNQTSRWNRDRPQTPHFDSKRSDVNNLDNL